MKKKIIIGSLIFFVVLIFILIKFEYKSAVSGNNISKSDINDILNISSYEALVEVQVYSNKNTNKYLMKQKYEKPNKFSQEVLEPNSIKGLTIISDGENTTLENKNLGLKNVYENFKGEPSNLNLISFINEYKEGTGNEVEELADEIILTTKITKNYNKYQAYQNLRISKNTNLPTKMEILDINRNRVVYILYNEIKIK